MDPKLERLVRKLGEAVNDSLCESSRIAAAIAEIKNAGYDIFLVVEGSIGFSKLEKAEEEGDRPQTPLKPKAKGVGKLKLTAKDLRFMRELEISLGDDEPPAQGE
jgi:hypothetical protein